MYYTQYITFVIACIRVCPFCKTQKVGLWTSARYITVLCYGIEACPANKSDTRSLQYVVDNCFRKIFDIKLKETVEVEECMREFKVSTVNDVTDARRRKFWGRWKCRTGKCRTWKCRTKSQGMKMQDLKMEDLLGMRRAFVVRGRWAQSRHEQTLF